MAYYKRIDLNELRELARKARGEITNIYIHWTAGHYQQYFDDYHLLVDYDGKIISTTDDLTTVLAHTWRRNTGAIGMAMCCCYGATCQRDGTIDFGGEPPTAAMIDSTAQVVAVLCEELGLPIAIPQVQTHAEVADTMGNGDNYGPKTTFERWDLWYLPDLPGDGQMKPGGEVIRGKAIYWDAEWRKNGQYTGE